MDVSQDVITQIDGLFNARSVAVVGVFWQVGLIAWVLDIMTDITVQRVTLIELIKLIEFFLRGLIVK